MILQKYEMRIELAGVTKFTLIRAWDSVSLYSDT